VLPRDWLHRGVKPQLRRSDCLTAKLERGKRGLKGVKGIIKKESNFYKIFFI
jgi:hypothetical protein